MDFLEEEYFYHIFNRGNNKQNLFFEKENYGYFLQLLEKHILPIADIYSYCLLPNHFHLLIQIKKDASNPSQKFSNFFNSYTKSINKRYKRTGSLFQKPFKRIRVKDENYLMKLVTYIHFNPENHNIANDFEKYSFSSYNVFWNLDDEIILSQNKKEVLDWFGGSKNFIATHKMRRPFADDAIYLE